MNWAIPPRWSLHVSLTAKRQLLYLQCLFSEEREQRCCWQLPSPLMNDLLEVCSRLAVNKAVFALRWLEVAIEQIILFPDISCGHIQELSWMTLCQTLGSEAMKVLSACSFAPKSSSATEQRPIQQPYLHYHVSKLFTHRGNGCKTVSQIKHFPNFPVLEIILGAGRAEHLANSTLAD